MISLFTSCSLFSVKSGATIKIRLPYANTNSRALSARAETQETPAAGQETTGAESSEVTEEETPEPDIPEVNGVLSFTITFTYQDNTSFERTGKSGDTITVNEIAAGTYKISAVAKDWQKNPVYEGTTVVTLVSGETANVNLKLKRIQTENPETDLIFTGDGTDEEEAGVYTLPISIETLLGTTSITKDKFADFHAEIVPADDIKTLKAAFFKADETQTEWTQISRSIVIAKDLKAYEKASLDAVFQISETVPAKNAYIALSYGKEDLNKETKLANAYFGTNITDDPFTWRVSNTSDGIPVLYVSGKGNMPYYTNNPCKDLHFNRIEIGTGITSVNDTLAAGYRALQPDIISSIKLPSTLKKIDTGSFANRPIEAVTIPASVTEIGENAFCNIYSKTLSVITLDWPAADKTKRDLSGLSGILYYTNDAVPHTIVYNDGTVYKQSGFKKHRYNDNTEEYNYQIERPLSLFNLPENLHSGDYIKVALDICVKNPVSGLYLSLETTENWKSILDDWPVLAESVTANTKHHFEKTVQLTSDALTANSEVVFGYNKEDLDAETDILSFEVAVYRVDGEGGIIVIDDPEPEPKEITFFDFEKESWRNKNFAPVADGSTYETVSGEGINSSKCLKVTQTETYGQLFIDLTKAYSNVKSYYLECWIKDAGTPASVNNGESKASFSLWVWDQDIVDIAKTHGGEYYDWDTSWDPNQPAPWDAQINTDYSGFEKALAPYEPADSCSSVAISKNKWTKLSGIIHAEDIANIVYAKNPDDLVGFDINIYCGEYPNQNGYIWYVDNLRIVDLNSEIPTETDIYEDPNQQPYTGKPTDIKYGLVTGLKSYYVSDVDGLRKLAEIVNGTEATEANSLAGYTITQTADIIVNENVLQDGFLEPDEGPDCTPNPNLVNLDSIGKWDAPFSGTYDGNNHIISGLYIYQGYKGVGFIGDAAGATIKNVVLLDSCVINNNASGEADGSDDDRVGGLVGLISGEITVIENCTFIGVVGSEEALVRGGLYEYIGGLVGRCNKPASATNCAVLARVYGYRDRVDVICGYKKENLSQNNVIGIDVADLDTATVLTVKNEYVKQAALSYISSNTTYYTVRHLLQTADGTAYEKTEEEIMQGLKGNLTAAGAKTYTGFEAQPIEQKKIADNGSTIVEIKYNRIVITLKTGSKINRILKTIGEKATHFAKSTTAPQSPEYYLDAKEKYVPVWYNESNTTIYYYLNGTDSIKLNRDSSYMFSELSSLESIYTADFDTSNVTNMSQMFNSCSGLTFLDITGFNTSRVTDMNWMFNCCSELTSLDVSGFDTSSVTNMSGMFSCCSGLTSLDVSNFNTSSVTDMGWMFSGCSGLTSLDVSDFNTSNVTSMSYTFSECSRLTLLVVSGFDTSSVTNMSGMFSCCSGLTSLDVSNFNTSRVTSMDDMFYGCSGLTSLDVSNFNTSRVTYMSCIFYDCSGLTSLDVSGFNTSSITYMDHMFYGCSGLTSLDVSGFNTSRVTDMGDMFGGCSGLTSLDLSNFNTSNVTDMSQMFSDCSELTTIYAASGTNWSSSENITGYDQMFSGCEKLTGGAGTTYTGDDITYARIDGGSDAPGYFTKK